MPRRNSINAEGKYNNYQALTDRMIKKIIISATAAIVLAISWQTTAAGQSPWISNDTLAHNLVWEDRLYRQVEFLSGSLCEGRATGSAGGCEAAFWIIRNFRKSRLLDSGPGYARHIYAGDGIVGHNIIGMVPGSKKEPRDSYIIIGDTIVEFETEYRNQTNREENSLALVTGLHKIWSRTKTAIWLAFLIFIFIVA